MIDPAADGIRAAQNDVHAILTPAQIRWINARRNGDEFFIDNFCSTATHKRIAALEKKDAIEDSRETPANMTAFRLAPRAYRQCAGSR